MTTAKQALAAGDPADILGIGQFCHFDHSGRGTHAVEPQRHFHRNDRQRPDIVGARRLSSSDGYSGKSGQSQENCGFDSGQSRYRIGHSGNSIRDHQSQLCPNDFEIPQSAKVPEPGLEFWRNMYEERAAIREYNGGYLRSEAELLGWRELQCRWHMAHCQPAAAGVCAGCDQPIGNENVIVMLDGNRVHDRNGHACLIRYGQRWRDAATKALIALGLRPPGALRSA
jgi:hypothetical protein